MKTIGSIIVGVLVAIYCIGRFFNKDIREDIENDKVNRHYSGDK